MKDESGNFQRSEASKGEVVIKYFQELIKSSSPLNFHDLFQDFNSRVTHDMYSELIKEVSAEEVKDLIFAINS